MRIDGSMRWAVGAFVVFGLITWTAAREGVADTRAGGLDLGPAEGAGGARPVGPDLVCRFEERPFDEGGTALWYVASNRGAALPAAQASDFIAWFRVYLEPTHASADWYTISLGGGQ
ncbi:MAG: hypothetical protein KC635_09360, partial [Myxococcales bacterium]|nr:hypothetical protein [Myxococcales bacterium]